MLSGCQAYKTSHGLDRKELEISQGYISVHTFQLPIKVATGVYIAGIGSPQFRELFSSTFNTNEDSLVIEFSRGEDNERQSQDKIIDVGAIVIGEVIEFGFYNSHWFASILNKEGDELTEYECTEKVNYDWVNGKDSSYESSDVHEQIEHIATFNCMADIVAQLVDDKEQIQEWYEEDQQL